MAIPTAGGKRRKITPQLNVTPLVDVVLVLLIIFMVVTPLLTKQFWLHVPKKDDAPAQPAEAKQPLVLSLLEDGTLRINREPITDEELAHRLPRMFAARGDHVLVFDAKDGAGYGRAVAVMDRARAAGAVTIAVSPREIP